MTHKQVKPIRKKATKRVKKAATQLVKPVAPQEKPAAYIRAIEIAASPFDAKKIAIALAKHDPELFVKLYDSTTSVETWQRDAITMLYRGEMVSAIKLLRTVTGMGLKEAKDIADAVRWHMSQNGYMISASEPQIKLSAEQEVWLQKLATAAYNMR